ncbi:PLP-dependent aminotransferase family protein [Brevibacillus composti]|uniref:PLP-dependent aminotransferase family protein n=1 Tax=Brevibacillus composti TaxID=2796470 RepID=A0A7T5EN57_9BACL|nr:PLP-dependent aminotransferase family protein [Brevibacillus composti]QQE75665.1 PLP-dependent aminotransferase family protein [Brevibacillus composti]QUO42691.1 PLP-dependent aminotransferase family protein [Brevibacillus composti]
MGRKAIYTRVYNQLRYEILSGEIAIGSPLPPERKLAEQLGVSRNTIVRAYSELEAEGFIVSRMGSGRYVEALHPAPSHAQTHWGKQASGKLAAAPSHMAELLSVTDTYPNTINFAHGDGGKHTLESSCFSDYVKSTAEQLHSYYFTSVQGLPELRERLVAWMDMEPISSPEQVVITSGSQEGLYLITSLLARPGDLVVTEMPTYFGSLQLFQSLGVQIIPVPMDANGMRIDVLEGILARYRPRFLYTVPTYHNPTGWTMSLDRRKKLLALSERYQLPIVEDDAYRHLHLDAEPPPSLKSMDRTGNVIYLNTFSKLLFPGLRVGWVAANRSFARLLTRMKELSITTNTLGQLALAAYLRDDALRPHLQEVRKQYAEQAAIMAGHLDRFRPLGIRYERPAGGFYFWVSLPEEINPRQLMTECLQQGVSFTCGDMFLLREAEQPYIRLCFTHERTDQIDRGMKIIDHVLQSRKELLS